MENNSEVCNWIQEEDGFYNTDCYGIFILWNVSAEINEFKFCPFCGKKINIIDRR